MTQPVKDDPRRQCDVLTAKGSALLAVDDRYLDPEMADFVSHYLRSLTCDVREALCSENKEQRALLPLILSELYELVEDIQHRIERPKGTSLKVSEKDNPGWQRYP